MKNTVAALCFVILSFASVFAADASHKPILIFRTNGVIDLLYNDEVSKIELSKLDVDSVEHENYVIQEFYLTGDSVLRIPIEEIDSVAFGARNSIKPKKNVRRLTDEEANAITKFDGSALYYASSTPSSLIVSSGEIVYYDRITDVMPYGLCAKVGDVKTQQGEIVANITYLDPSDVFDEYLIFNPSSEFTKSSARFNAFDKRYPFVINAQGDGYKIHSELNLLDINLEPSDEVYNPIKDYYHTRFRLYISPKVELDMTVLSESGELEFCSETVRTPKIGSWWLKAYADLGFFLRFWAEMGFNFKAELSYEVEFEWIRNDGQDQFTNPIVIERNRFTNEILSEIHFKGELFFGAKIKLYLSTLFNRIGAGASIYFGPNLTADFSLASIQKLGKDFDEALYGKAELYAEPRLLFEPFWYHLDHILWGDLAEYELPFKSDLRFSKRTLKLFPDFNTRAVSAKETQSFVQQPNAPKAIDIASYSETNIEMPLDIKYEIEDAQSGNVIAEVPDYTATVNSHSEELQTYNTELILSDSLANMDPKNVRVSPIIQYGEYRVHARPASVASDMVFSPIIATLSNNSAYFVSGMTPVSQHDYEERTYIEGNILPIADSNSKFDNTANTIEFENLAIPGTFNRLIGTWSGIIDNQQTTLSFNADSTGTYNEESFSYRINSPTKGGVSITLDNDGSIVFYILKITDNALQIMDRKMINKYTLSK